MESVEEHEYEAEGALRAVATGDRRALNWLYREYGRTVWALAWRVLGNAPDAEEVVQDTFVKIWQQAERYDPGRSRPLGWIVVIGRNLAIDRLRQRKREAATELLAEQSLPEEDQILEKNQETTSMPTTEEWNELWSQLAAGEREALRLSFFEGCTHEEISQRLSRPLGTIKSEIRRGLLKLRGILKREVSL